MSGAPGNSYLAMLKTGQELGENLQNYPVVRVALLADHAPQQYAEVLKAALLEHGLFPALHVADYDTAAFQLFTRRESKTCCRKGGMKGGTHQQTGESYVD